MDEIIYHPEAEAEIQAAVARYQTRSERAAVGLVQELERSLDLIQRFPEMQPLYDERHRFAVLRRFPYSIIYRVETDRIRIMAFAGSGRAPGYWLDRA